VHLRVEFCAQNALKLTYACMHSSAQHYKHKVCTNIMGMTLGLYYIHTQCWPKWPRCWWAVEQPQNKHLRAYV